MRTGRRRESGPSTDDGRAEATLPINFATSPIQRPAHAAQQRLGRQVVLASIAVVTGHQNDRERRVLVPTLSRQLPPPEPGHHQAREDEGDHLSVRIEELQGMLPVARLEDPVALSLQDAPDRDPDRILVLDHQQRLVPSLDADRGALRRRLLYDLRGARELEREGGAVSRRARHRDRSSQPGALAHRLGGEERIAR